MFIRVRDKTTLHEFDVPEDDWRISDGFYEPIKSLRYPPVDRPRPQKYHTPSKNVKEVKPHG